jgi:hypothetical protein
MLQQRNIILYVAVKHARVTPMRVRKPAATATAAVSCHTQLVHVVLFPLLHTQNIPAPNSVTPVEQCLTIPCHTKSSTEAMLHLSHARSSRYRLAFAALPSSASAAARLAPRATAESALHSSASVRYLHSNVERNKQAQGKHIRWLISRVAGCLLLLLQLLNTDLDALVCYMTHASHGKGTPNDCSVEWL